MENLQNFFKLKTRTIKKNKGEFFTIALILLIGAFLRLYKIDGFMTFLGGEGRDAIVVRRLLVNFDLILIGPGTSIGNMYLGPLYYYLSAPFLFLANYSPVGPSVMVALFGLATVYLIWYISKIWFGKQAAVVASLLYALSPIVIIYSRSSWNPNIMPFFSLLTIVCIWKIWNEGKYIWFPVLGISFAFVLQSHYLGLLLAPTLLLFWALKYWSLIRNSSLAIKSLWKSTWIGLAIFAFLMSALLVFDLRHDWMNFNAIKIFFTQRQETVSIKPWKSIPNLFPLVRDNLSVRIVSGADPFVGGVSTVVIGVLFVLTVLFVLRKFRKLVFDEEKKDYSGRGLVVLTAWLFFGVFGLGLYKQHIYDHYFGFLFPAVFLLIGGIYQKIYNFHFESLKIIFTAWIVLLVGTYIVNSPIRGVPNYQMRRAQEVAKQIRKDVGSAKFNLAVIAQQNYEDGYQYFLEKDGANVVDIDAQKLNETVGQYLYVVCEMAKEKCDPTHSPKAEIANFGWSKIEAAWEVEGVTVYKLAHAI